MGKHADSEKIAKAIATLDIHDYGDVLQCMRCGTCLPTCPTYRTDGIETQSPRGRVAMIKAVIDGRLAALRRIRRSTCIIAWIAAIARLSAPRE